MDDERFDYTTAVNFSSVVSGPLQSAVTILTELRTVLLCERGRKVCSCAQGDGMLLIPWPLLRRQFKKQGNGSFIITASMSGHIVNVPMNQVCHSLLHRS